MQRITRSVLINAPLEDCYREWMNFSNFPMFMENVKQVMQNPDNPDVWHWEVVGPLGTLVKWDAAVENVIPNRTVSWHSVTTQPFGISGTVNFHKEGEDKTRIDVDLAYEPPLGEVGEFVANLTHNPSRMIRQDLKNFKHTVEKRYGKTLADTPEASGYEEEKEATYWTKMV